MGSSPSQQDTTPQESLPAHDTPILGMVVRPRVPLPVEYGNETDYWVEYPTGLVDVSRSGHLSAEATSDAAYQPPPLKASQLDIQVDGDRVLRVDREKTALVVIDMQK